MRFLADQPPVTFPTIDLGCGNWCSLNYTTLITSAIALLIVILIAVLLVTHLAPGRPGRFQAIFEWLYGYVRDQVHDLVAEDAAFVVPLAGTLGIFILVSNWLEAFPLDAVGLRAPTADLNLTLALTLLVILMVQGYSIKVQGFRGYLHRFTKPFDGPIPLRAAFTPLNIIEEAQKILTLSFRLFGNLLAGAMMIWLLGYLLGNAPIWLGGPFIIAPVATTLWKLFDVFFIGTIQAYIFMLLTIVYFGQAREGMAGEHH
ncbi:MAG TPA: F0F1 ATP synthase subunit A [Candidatus Dormibacteraeota bacterium]|jgi:F-type H+-transporting ATPase subunit a|nr:F0F1 ATP synthase subunit A [Candidatus Dormibacteraeota bacterium]